MPSLHLSGFDQHRFFSAHALARSRSYSSRRGRAVAALDGRDARRARRARLAAAPLDPPDRARPRSGAPSSPAWCCSSPSGSSRCRSASPTCGGSITGGSGRSTSPPGSAAQWSTLGAGGGLGDGDDRAARGARAPLSPLVAHRVAGDRRDRRVLRLRVGLAQRRRRPAAREPAAALGRGADRARSST